MNPLLRAKLEEWWELGRPAFRDDWIVRFEASGHCQVMAASSLEGRADWAIQREKEHFQRLGKGFEWTLFSSEKPSDLRDKLEVHGFSIGTREAICCVDPQRLAAPEPGVRVARVTDEAGLADFKSVAEEVFDKDFSYTTGVLAESLAQGNTMEVGFVAYDGAVPVSVGRLATLPGGKFAGLYTGGTRGPWRGRGFYRATVWARARFALELGATYLTVDAKPTSLPILTGLGFERLEDSWPCDWTPTV